jgi:hypothetical protein
MPGRIQRVIYSVYDDLSMSYGETQKGIKKSRELSLGRRSRGRNGRIETEKGGHREDRGRTCMKE